MLGSSELLRKKICVTVFLDELFEELDEETSKNRSSKSDKKESSVRIAEETSDEQMNMFIYESDASNSCKRNKEERRTRLRKPKHRSKFGKSKSHSNDEESQNERESERVHKASVSKIVTTKVSAPVMTDESFLSGKGVRDMIDEEIDCARRILLFTKSTQFDSPIEILSVNKEQQTEEKYPEEQNKHLSEENTALHDLKSMLENYIKLKECSTSRIVSGLMRSDGLSSSEQISNLSAQVLMRNWSSCKKIWNESFESEMSEVECVPKGDSVALESGATSTVKMEKSKNYIQFVPSANSDTKVSKLLRKGEECRQETKSVILETPEEARVLEQTKFRVPAEPANQFECKSKNFAEGDTNEEPKSTYVLQVEPKENLVLCNKVLNQETHEVIISKTRVQIINSDNIPQQFAEVFVQKSTGNSDTESEMVFAESSHDGEEVRVIEFEDTISKTKFLKRIKTVEILGNASSNDMKNISTELILICEDGDKENIFVESLKSVSEMKELYLKDSKESTMYLIEVPLHFIISNKNETAIVGDKSDE